MRFAIVHLQPVLNRGKNWLSYHGDYGSYHDADRSQV